MIAIAAQQRFEGALDLRRLRAVGCAFGDCTLRTAATEMLRATRTPEGPATLHAAIAEPGVVALRAFGDGAGWALAHARDLLGLDGVAPDTLPAGARALRLMLCRE